MWVKEDEVFNSGRMVGLVREPHDWSRRRRTAGVDVKRLLQIAAGVIPAIRDRDVLPSQLRSRLNVADKSQRRRDLGKLGRRRKAFERRPDCGLRVGVAPT